MRKKMNEANLLLPAKLADGVFSIMASFIETKIDNVIELPTFMRDTGCAIKIHR